MFRKRIIRSLIVTSILMLGVRVYDLYERKVGFEEILVSKTIAQEDSSEGDTAGAVSVEEEDEEIVSVEQIKALSDVEIDILQRLSERKKRLLKWERDLDIKEDVLSLTEEKIDKKLESLRELKKKVEVALKEYRQEEDKKTKSLVKIYENMKPKNAAEILAKMKIKNTLPILGRMKEKNAAEILAKMDPRIAKEITAQLTEIGRLENR